MKIKITDPHGLISFIRLIHESKNAVVIYGDMTKNGKRAFVNQDCDSFILTPDVETFVPDIKAEIELQKLPFSEYYTARASVSRYSLFIVLISSEAMVNSKEIYLKKD